jgi:hypothetical protein
MLCAGPAGVNGEIPVRSGTIPAMLELTLVLTAVVAVGLIVIVASVVTPGLIAEIGFGVLFFGLLIGLPTGFWYHVILYRSVSARMPLPPAWWLSPSNLHTHLTEAERRHIKPWYLIGGVGFVLCVVGGLAAIGGLLLGR